jgi:anthranilate phosphoribosyltransferase
MSIALNPQVLATVSSDQAEAVFEALSVSELTNTEVAALVEAVQEAPTEVRAAFEKEIDIFGEGLDDYVPLGSSIPVGTRRTLIAVTAGITLAAAGTRMRK